MAFRPSARSNSSRVSDTSNIDFKSFFENTQLKGLTTIENLQCDNFSINNSLRIADGSEIYNSDERNFYNKSIRNKFHLTEDNHAFPLLAHEFTQFNSSMYIVTIHREDGKFDEIASPYLVFYLVKGSDGSVLPPVTLIQHQVTDFSFSNDNDVLDVRFQCHDYDFDILLTMTQIS